MHTLVVLFLISSSIRAAVLLYFLGSPEASIYPRRLVRQRDDDAWLLIFTAVAIVWSALALAGIG